MEGKFPVVTYDQLTEKRLEWLWYPYIPFGKLTLIQGDPGDGKSTVVLDLAARVSAGKAMPDGTGKREPAFVLYQCYEDGAEDTVLPRITQAKAAAENIGFISSPSDEFITAETYDEAIKKTGAKMCIIDPLQEFFGDDGDMANAVSVRRKMKGLIQAAERNACAIVLIGHLNKTKGAKTLYRSMGSIDIVASVRSVLSVLRVDEASSIRVLHHTKSSLAPYGEDFGFEIDEENGLQWIGPVSVQDEQEALVEQSRKSIPMKQEKGVQQLIEWLIQADIPSNEVFGRLSQMGIQERTGYKIKRALGIQSIKKADGWYWHLSTEEDDDDE